jgi:hypothetical protein
MVMAPRAVGPPTATKAAIRTPTSARMAYTHAPPSGHGPKSVTTRASRSAASGASGRAAHVTASRRRR